MSKKIIMMGDPQPEVVEDFSYLDDPDDDDFGFPEGITDNQITVQAREDDVDQATADYILTLVNVEADIEDLGITKKMLHEIEDVFEMVLAGFGLTVYRPFLRYINGREVMYPNSTDGFEMIPVH